MIRLGAIFGIIVFGGAFLAVVMRIHQMPDVGLRSAELDVGAVSANSTISATFLVINTSSKTVRIRKVLTACSCTVPKGLPSSIGAGKCATLGVTIAVNDLDGPEVWTTAVEFSNGNMATYSVRARVQRAVPKEIRFTDSMRGAPKSMDFVMTCPPSQVPVHLLRAVYDTTYFTVTWREPIESPGQTWVRVTEQPDIPFGGFDKQLVLITNDARSPQRIVELRGRVVSRLDPLPDHIDFGRVVVNEPARRVIRLSAPYGDHFVIKDYRSEHPGSVRAIIGEVHPDGADLVVPVEVRLRDNDGAIAGTLRIFASAPKIREVVTIKYYAVACSRTK